MLRFVLAFTLAIFVVLPASAASIITKVFVPNTVEPLTFSADFEPNNIPASGLLPLTNFNFNGSSGFMALLVNDTFGTETIFFESGSMNGVFFGVDFGDFSPGVFAGDVFIEVFNPWGASFVKNVAGEVTITPLPAAAVFFGTALAGLAAFRRLRQR